MTKFQIEDIFTITGRGIVLSGRIIGDDNISTGDSIHIGGKKFKIIGVETFRLAGPHIPGTKGQNIGLLIGAAGITKEDLIKHRREIVLVISTEENRNQKLDNIL